MKDRALYVEIQGKDQNPLPSREQRRLEKRRLILEAGLTLFSTQGFARTRLDEVAEAAGVAKGTIYLYFKSKEALFEDVILETILPGIEAMEQEMSVFRGSEREKLVCFMRYFYSMLKNPHTSSILTLMIAEGFSLPRLREFYFREVISRTQKTLVQIIEDGVAAGEFRSTEVTRFTQIVVSPLLISAIWSKQMSEIIPLDADEFASTHIDLLLNGLLV